MPVLWWENQRWSEIERITKREKKNIQSQHVVKVRNEYQKSQEGQNLSVIFVKKELAAKEKQDP